MNLSITLNKKHTSLTLILEFFLYFFVFFPYLSFIPFPSDTQPYAALFSVFIFFMSVNIDKINKNIVYAIILFIISFLFFIFERNLFAFRDFFGFLSFFNITYASLYVLRQKGFNSKLFHYFSLIWIFIGLVQLFFIRDFMNFLISDSRTTTTRGVTSLAVEPSYFGIILIFFMLIELLTTYNKKWMLLYSICIIILTQSAMAVLYLMVFAGIYYSIYNKRIFFVTIIFIILLFVILLNIDSTSRLINLLQKIVTVGPIKLIQLDGSINDRIGHIYFSFKGFFINYFLPHGFSSWAKYLAVEVPKQTFFWNITPYRIMSSYGSALFTLGFIGLLLPFIYNRVIYKITNKRKKIFLFLFLNIFYLTAIPISFPLFSFFLALLIKSSKWEDNNVSYITD